MLTRTEPAPRRHQFYRACDSCGYTYLPQRADEAVCRLCRTAKSIPFLAKKIEPVRPIAAYNHTCEMCGKKFYAETGNALVCSDACRRKYTTQYENERRRKIKAQASRALTCAWCEARFETSDSRRVTCSPECAKQVKLQQGREYRARRAEQERQQLRSKMAAADERRTG